MTSAGALGNVYLFRDLPPADRSTLEALLTRSVHAPGDIVFHEGDHAQAMYVIAEGTVEIVKQSSGAVVAKLGQGDTFGELAFFDDRPRSAAVRARERTVVALLPYAALRDLLTGRPELAATFYRNATAPIIERLRSTTSDVAWLTAYVSGG